MWVLLLVFRSLIAIPVLGVLLCVLPLLCQAVPLQEMPPQELMREAATRMAANQCKDALPYLNEIVRRFRNLNIPAARSAIEWAYYHYAMAYADLKQYEESIKYCETYFQEFPTGGLRVQLLMLVCEIRAVQSDWEKVEEAARRLLKEKDLAPKIVLTANQMLGEALYHQKKWADALEPLSQVFRLTRDRDAQRQAAVMLTTSLVRLERFDDLNRFLPILQRSAARFDVELNVALLEAAEANYDKRRYIESLFLYRLVYVKEELRQAVNKLIAQTQQELQAYIARGGVTAPELVAQRERAARLIKSYQEQLQQINDFPDYDQDLIMRVARTYSALNRHWEALLLFRSVYEDFPKHELAQVGLYAAFTTAVTMPHPARAIAEGYEYLKAYPQGNFFDIVALTLAQIHIERNEFAKALAVAETGLEGKPDSSLKDHLTYLIGFCHVHLEQYNPAIQRFTEIIEKYPTSVVALPSRYWRAMSLLFDGKYDQAIVEFKQFLALPSTGEYRADAFYRLGVAYYGADDFKSAADTFQEFIQQYPQHNLVSEAHAMLGDIYGSWRKLDEAIACFTKAQETATTFTQLNYAVFQQARVYELESRYPEIIALFQKYLERWGERGNFTQAIYWISTAQSRSGQIAEALKTLFDAIIRYGDKPEHYGVDMMVYDLIAQQERMSDSPDFKKFMERLDEELRKAHNEKKRTLELRLIALFAESSKDPQQRQTLLSSLLREDNIKEAGPITLKVMGDEALRQGRKEFARKIYEYFIAHHDKSDLVLYPYVGLSEMDFAEGHYDTAETMLKEITNRFASTPEAAHAQKRLADVYRLRKEYAKAIETYNTILGTREWRGELWPESLYWIGICHLEQGKTEEAFAYFQRLYVLYEGFPTWAAKGYLKSAECLQRLNRQAEAIKTYQEMLGNESILKTPEAETARRELQRLGAATS